MKRYYVYITITFLLLSACSATVHAVEPEADAGIILTDDSEPDDDTQTVPADDSEPDDALENDSNEYRISVLSDLPEITVVYGADLFLQGRTLECGDEEGLTDLLDTLSLNFQSIGGLTDDEDEAELVLDEIDDSALDLSTPGTYTVIIRLKLSNEYSTEYTISDETRTLSLSVTVTAPDELALTYSKTTQEFIQYLISPPGENTPALWYAVAEPGSGPSENDWTSDIPEGFYTYTQGGIRIYQAMLDADKNYYLRICRGGLTSDPVKIVPSTNGITDDGMGGDRDGSDTDDGTLDKPLIQASPSGSGSTSSGSKSSTTGGQTAQAVAASSGNQSETSTVYERIDGNTLTISGSRLRMMLSSNAAIIPFGWNGISLEIPASFIETLALADTDTLSLTLTHEDKLSFSVFLTVSGTEIKEISPSLIRIPAQMPEGKYSLLRSGETIPVEVSYESDCAVFLITQTGRYMLKDVPITAADIEAPDAPEKTTASNSKNAGETDKTTGTAKTPGTAGTSAPSDDEPVTASSMTGGTPGSDVSENTLLSPDPSAQRENTPPAPNWPDALPAAAAGTVSVSVGIYWLWRKHR